MLVFHCPALDGIYLVSIEANGLVQSNSSRNTSQFVLKCDEKDRDVSRIG